MQKAKDIKQEEYKDCLVVQKPMSLKQCMDTNSRMQIVAPEKKISCKNGIQQNNVCSKRNKNEKISEC